MELFELSDSIDAEFSEYEKIYLVSGEAIRMLDYCLRCITKISRPFDRQRQVMARSIIVMCRLNRLIERNLIRAGLTSGKPLSSITVDEVDQQMLLESTSTETTLTEDESMKSNCTSTTNILSPSTVATGAIVIKPLSELSVVEVGRLLEALSFEEYKDVFHRNKIDGRCLMHCTGADDVVNMGIHIIVKAKVFYDHLVKLQSAGCNVIRQVNSYKNDDDDDDGSVSNKPEVGLIQCPSTCPDNVSEAQLQSLRDAVSGIKLVVSSEGFIDTLLEHSEDNYYIELQHRKDLYADFTMLKHVLTDLISNKTESDHMENPIAYHIVRRVLEPKYRFYASYKGFNRVLSRRLSKLGVEQLMFCTGASAFTLYGRKTKADFLKDFQASFDRLSLEECGAIVCYEQIIGMGGGKMVEECSATVRTGDGTWDKLFNKHQQFITSNSTADRYGTMGHGTVSCILQLVTDKRAGERNCYDKVDSSMLFGSMEEGSGNGGSRNLHHNFKFHESGDFLEVNNYALTSAHVAYNLLKMELRKSNQGVHESNLGSGIDSLDVRITSDLVDDVGSLTNLSMYNDFNTSSTIPAIYDLDTDIALIPLDGKLQALEGEAFMIESEMSGDWRNWDDSVVKLGSIVVKVGAKSGISVGTLLGRSDTEGSEVNVTYRDCIRVKSVVNNHRFCQPGDSGSLYLALENGYWRPLGIHRTSDASGSYAVSLSESLQKLKDNGKIHNFTSAKIYCGYVKM